MNENLVILKFIIILLGNSLVKIYHNNNDDLQTYMEFKDDRIVSWQKYILLDKIQFLLTQLSNLEALLQLIDRKFV